MMMFRSVPLVTTCGIALISLLHAPAAEATSMSCVGVSAVAPANTSVLNMNSGGQPSCVVAPDGALTLTGTMLPGADLGLPIGTTIYTYDSLGGLVGDTSTTGPTSFTYSTVDHRLVSDTDGTVSTFYKYDSHGNLIEAQTFTGSSLTNDETYSYDAQNRLVGTTNGSTTFSYTYDSTTNLLLSQTDGTFMTTYTYDSVNDLVEVDTTIGAITSHTSYSYDSGGMLHQVQDPTGGITRYTYDALGNLTGIINPSGFVTTFTYDSSHHLLSDSQTPAVTRIVYAAPAAIPEPGTILLVGFGAAGLFQARRRRRAERVDC